MSTEDKTQSTPTTSTLVPPGDHRKRRRNRTTQSCLNCHASKRMCDRKRPACQRCTTLGLTGLCVYEVDDPSQRGGHTDEKGVLRNRVAELEGVIREMKKKPHPRWAQKSSNAPLSSDDDSEPPSATSLVDAGSEFQSSSPFVHPPSLMVEPADIGMPGIQLTPVMLPSGSSSPSCGPIFSPQDPHYLSAYSLPSPPSSPLSTSPRPSQRPQIQIITDPDSPMSEPASMPNDSQLMSTGMKSASFEEGVYGHMLDHIMRSDEARRAANGLFVGDRNSAGRKETCSCIDNVLAYNVLLELSVRLRKAVESLARVPDHHLNGGDPDCQLYAKICELDKLTSTALGNAMSPADRLQTRDSYFPLSSNELSATISPQCLGGVPWDSTVPKPASTGASDNFMSWDGIQQESWPQPPL